MNTANGAVTVKVAMWRVRPDVAGYDAGQLNAGGGGARSDAKAEDEASKSAMEPQYALLKTPD